jgi:SAM-dependent methyltransferase
MLRTFTFFILLITACLSTSAVEDATYAAPRIHYPDRNTFGANPTDPFKSQSGFTRCPKQFDLTDSTILRPLLKGVPSDDHQSFETVSSFIKERYELIPAGQIFSDKFQGKRDVAQYPLPPMILPIPAELVALGMHLSPGRRVLVMDGKDGITPFLFAASGAVSVLISHTDEGEQAFFNKRKEALPQLASQLESVCCDPLKLLETRPDLKGTIDMFYCAHLLQVLPQDRFEALFQMIKDLLSPNGFVFFLTNYGNSGDWPPKIRHYERDNRTYNLFGLLSLSPLCGEKGFNFYAGLYFDQKGHRVLAPNDKPVTYSAAIISPTDVESTGSLPQFVN